MSRFFIHGAEDIEDESEEPGIILKNVQAISSGSEKSIDPNLERLRDRIEKETNPDVLEKDAPFEISLK